MAKTAFVASLVLAAFLYGFAARGFGLFPNDVLGAGWRQFQAVQRGVWTEQRAGTAPKVYDRHGARVLDSAAVQPGLTLIPSIWEDYGWNPGLKLIDVRGRVIHEWRMDPADIFPSEFQDFLTPFMEFTHPYGSVLLPSGDVIVNFSELGTVRLDACSRVKWRVRADHHHSVSRAEDGTFYVSGRKAKRAPDPITGMDSVRHDMLVHLSAQGEVLKKIAVFDILRQNELLLRRHLRLQPEDTHLNDVEPLSPSMEHQYPLFDAGDLLVSLRHLNVVLVVDPETLNVKWWTGEPFIRQHDPDFVGEGWIGVFDNQVDGTDRGTRLGGNRVVAFNPASDSTTVWLKAADANVYSDIQGSWQSLQNGNLLVVESTAGRVAEISRDGQLVWEWIQKPSGERRVPRVYWAERYEYSAEQTASWGCSSGNSLDRSE